MAAMVDRPVSAMSNSMDPVVSQRRPRDVEVIDVDSLDDPIPASRHTSAQPQPRPLQRRNSAMNGGSEREEVIVLDSDEDDLAVRTTGASHRASRSRLFSPPPQPYRPSPIPPVPPVPPRYASNTSFPTRRWSPSVHLPPVRPINRPFDFEARNSARAAGPSNSRRPPRSLPLHASAPSHHVPSMGLGGALISSYRESQRQTNSQPGLLARAGAAATGLANRLSRNLVGIGMGPEVALNFGSHDDNALARLLVETEMQELFGDLNHRHLLRHLSRERHSQSATYQAAYTHPNPAEPGFTNDFAPEATPPNSQRRKNSGPIIIDDDVSASSSKRAHWASSPSSVKSNTVLACARCLDPLVLGAGLVGDEGERRKIWALRCGHMIDGKCLMEIGHPQGDATDEETTSRTYMKGKGKARASPAKGKVNGKAKIADDSSTERENDDSSASLISMMTETNTIRSRLRSSRTHSTGSIPEFSLPLSSLSSSAATRRRRPRKPKIESEHQYLCPVAGCGHVHVSVKVNGKWRPERDDDRKKPGGRRTVKFPDDLGVDIDGGIEVRGRGAIPVFV